MLQPGIETGDGTNGVPVWLVSTSMPLALRAVVQILRSYIRKVMIQINVIALSEFVTTWDRLSPQIKR